MRPYIRAAAVRLVLATSAPRPKKGDIVAIKDEDGDWSLGTVLAVSSVATSVQLANKQKISIDREDMDYEIHVLPDSIPLTTKHITDEMVRNWMHAPVALAPAIKHVQQRNSVPTQDEAENVAKALKDALLDKYSSSQLRGRRNDVFEKAYSKIMADTLHAFGWTHVKPEHAQSYGKAPDIYPLMEAVINTVLASRGELPEDEDDPLIPSHKRTVIHVAEEDLDDMAAPEGNIGDDVALDREFNMASRGTKQDKQKFLVDEWERMNLLRFGGAMKKPSLMSVYTKSEIESKTGIRGVLGYWLRSKREIAFVERVWNATYRVFKLVLLHEMCHQAVSEISKLVLDDPHGDKWKEWMHKIGMGKYDAATDSTDINEYMTDEERREAAKNRRVSSSVSILY